MANKNQSLRFKLGLAKWRIWVEEIIQSLIGSMGKTDEDIEQIQNDIEQLQIDTEKFKISTSAFEKSLAKDATYNWSEDLIIDEKDDVYYISLNPDVASVDQNGVVTMLVDTTPVLAEILAVGKVNTERLLVLADGLSGFKVYHATDDDVVVGFDGNAWLLDRGGLLGQITSMVSSPCLKGWIYLVFSNVGAINIPDNNLKGSIRSLASGTFICSSNELDSLTLPNASEVTCSNNKLSNLITPSGLMINAYNNVLTAESIANLLTLLVEKDKDNGILLLDNHPALETKNAPIEEWPAQAVADKDYLVIEKLWDISYNSNRE